MTHRRLFCPRARREKMDNSIITRCRNQFWFGVFALFVFWYLLLYVYDWSSLREPSLIAEKQANSIKSLHSNSVQLPNIDNEIVGTKHIIGDDRISDVSRDVIPVKDHGERPTSRSSVEKELHPFLGANEAKNGNKSAINKKGRGADKKVVKENGVKQGSALPVVKTRREPKSCLGRYIYVHDLPNRFNDDVIKQCRLLSKWSDMCQYMVNMGFGPDLGNPQRIFLNTGWFTTQQFSLDVIFHNRMKQYECLTNDSSKASAIFVPYYAGLDVARYLWGSNISMRDSASSDLAKWLREKPEWKVMWGRDHFLVAGRITWDFRRGIDEDSGWGNKLMLLPEAKNMTILTIESSPWNSNDFAIPYPTYFHPSSDNEVFQWQNKMRRQRRRILFSFAGAPRPNLDDSIRSQIMEQCLASSRKCRLLECKNDGNKCHKPANVMKMFQSSVFCLQPPGDSFTRRSTFDSILAGCIPVFFTPGSAYVQYLWHLPKDFDKYSVLIPEDEVKEMKVSAMREEVIRLIPKVIYADPRSRLETLEDAFDFTVKGVLERVEALRRDIKEGRNSSTDFDEEQSWKYNLFGTVEKHEWDHFFLRTNRASVWT
ncbi:unnamed protein product [Ilex paraguariensis]|uniref:Exostosin GT47 domain-containing protein n=1 Tax=Ilex paraguariensis TaxID=185542 RepID=A0ABC8R2X4_9AQUA